MSVMAPPAVPDPTLAERLESLSTTLSEAAKTLREGQNIPPGDHTKLVESLKDTLEQARQPRDDLNDLLTSFVHIAAIRIFVDWNVFEKIPATGSISYKDLAASVGSDENLITRISWILVSQRLLKQTGTDHVSHTAKSKLYSSTNALSAMLKLMYDEYVPPLGMLLKYFETYGRKEPTGKLHSIKAFAEGEPESTVPEIFNRDPKRIANIMLAMTAMENMYPHAGLYDFSWVAAKASESPDRTLIVDVGGAKGFTLQTICKETPNLPISRCVLEDLPKVIQAVKEHGDADIKSAQLVGMDYHKEQPIKGALVYFIRRCLHDYGDEDSITILKNIVAAMAPDSKLLIGDTVISNPPSRTGSMIDFFLGTIGGKERTIQGFESVIAQAGLKVTAVLPAKESDFTIIECEKA